MCISECTWNGGYICHWRASLLRLYLCWSLCTLYFFVCQVRVTIVNSGVCCLCDIFGALINSLVCWFWLPTVTVTQVFNLTTMLLYCVDRCNTQSSVQINIFCLMWLSVIFLIFSGSVWLFTLKVLFRIYQSFALL